MAQFINTNLASLNAQRNLNKSQGTLNVALQRMSSGLRINSAKDDAAGLAISERFTSQIRGLNQAARNASDGISLSQTAEGALASVGENLQRIRELAVQSANATNSATDRAALQTEVAQLVAEIDRVAVQTQFNGVNLLDGTFSAQAFQVGANANQTITISSIASARTAVLGQQYSAQVTSGTLDGTTNVNLAALTINGVTVGSSSVAADAKTLSDAINAAGISGVRAAITGATSAAAASQTAAAGVGTITINGVTTSSVTAVNNAATDRTAAVNAINAISAATGVSATDTGSGVSLSAADGRNIAVAYTQTSGSFAAANFGMAAVGTYESSYTVTYSGSAGGALTIGGTVTNSGLTGATNNVSLGGTSIANLTVATASGAQTAIQSVDAALSAINTSRATLGAIQSRFESTVSNLQTSSENFSASRSRIQDADFAEETAQLTRAQILQQAGVAMLAQANAVPQNVLALLR
jgi:flagellin